MSNFTRLISNIENLDFYDIIELHFKIQEAIKIAYKQRSDPKKLAIATKLCEQAISISAIVMDAMQEKHRAECREYLELFGKKSPNAKFFFPNHYAQGQLGVILRKNGEIEKEVLLNQKMQSEGWGSGRHEEL